MHRRRGMRSSSLDPTHRGDCPTGPSCRWPGWNAGGRVAAGAAPSWTGCRSGRTTPRSGPPGPGSDWLSRDSAEVDLFLADPRTGFPLTNQAWVDFIGGREHVAGIGFGAVEPTSLPILLIAGDKDPVGRAGKGVRMPAQQLTSAGLGDVTLTLYPGARHELVNETNRDQVHADLLSFLSRTVG